MNDREQAWGLLTEFTQSESLRKHALAVEACMRAYARKFGADEALWGVVGLIHDFDYERYPTAQEHPFKGNEILKERGYSDEIRRAIMSHADYTGVTRESQMEKALFRSSIFLHRVSWVFPPISSCFAGVLALQSNIFLDFHRHSTAHYPRDWNLKRWVPGSCPLWQLPPFDGY